VFTSWLDSAQRMLDQSEIRGDWRIDWLAAQDTFRIVYGPAMLEVLRDIAELHSSRPQGRRFGRPRRVCAECRTSYPCNTVQRMMGRLP
jgi:hypothetical protein